MAAQESLELLVQVRILAGQSPHPLSPGRGSDPRRPGPHRRLLAIGVLFVAALHPTPAIAESPQAIPPPLDSVRAREQAEELQRRFEALRIRFMPRRLGSSGGRCDERVGRMCWNYGADPDRIPRVENLEVSSITSLAVMSSALLITRCWAFSFSSFLCKM